MHESMSAKVHALNLETRTWEPRASLLHKRVGHDVIAQNGRLYVVGGQMLPKGAKQTHLTTAVEVFEPATNTWSECDEYAARLGKCVSVTA
jgi:N-acetylneuraminic acid mutarotase